jgi:hypothetical protein
MVVISLILFAIMAGRSKPVKKRKGFHTLYILLGAIAYAIITFINYLQLTPSAFINLIIVQVWLIAVGILHAHLMNRLLGWPSKEKIGWDLALTLIIAMLGNVLIFLYYAYVQMSPYPYLVFTLTITFLAPYFIVKAYHNFINIPPQVYKSWPFPNTKLPDPKDQELFDPVVIALEFYKRPEDEEITTFRAKAPLKMEFGRLFYFFIQDFNDRNPESKISITNEKRVNYSWQFYFKPKNIFSGKHFIDPEKTIEKNQIHENDVLICQRIIE